MPYRKSKRSRGRSRGQKIASSYFAKDGQVTLTSLANGGDAMFAIVDNSADLGNSAVKFNKITVQWQGGTVDQLEITCGVLRLDESEGSPQLDSFAIVKDFRNKGQMLRGPWMVTTVPLGQVAGLYTAAGKTIVLKNLFLDKNDDVVFAVTNSSGSAFSGSAQALQMVVRGFYRVVA